MSAHGRRRGSSLIEVLAAVTIGAILLSLAAAVIVLMLRWDSTVVRRTSEERARSQLARTLRDDTRALTARPLGLMREVSTEIKLPIDSGRQIEYKATPGLVERRVVSPQGVESAEQFRLGPQATSEFQLAREQDREFLRLHVSEPAQGQETARQYDFWAALPRQAEGP